MWFVGFVFNLKDSEHFLSQTCNMERAEELVREMEEEGIDAPIAIYHTMMDGYTMVADEKKGLIVFKRLKVTFCFRFGIFITFFFRI